MPRTRAEALYPSREPSIARARVAARADRLAESVTGVVGEPILAGDHIRVAAEALMSGDSYQNRVRNRGVDSVRLSPPVLPMMLL